MRISLKVSINLNMGRKRRVNFNCKIRSIIKENHKSYKIMELKKHHKRKKMKKTTLNQ